MLAPRRTGDLDVLVGNYRDEGNRLLLNDGLGNYDRVVLPISYSNTRAVALGDLDGDGDLDAVIANFHSEATEVLLNDRLPTWSRCRK